MQIDKNKFIEAGIKYIYSLDDFPRSDVRDQISKEFDEILDLNELEILESRSEYFGVGKSTDYLNKVIETGQGEVLAGIRHLGGDRDKPFVFIWPSFEIKSTKDIIDCLQPYFKMFKPKFYNYWCRPDKNKSSNKVYQQRYIGKLTDMKRSNYHLSRFDNYYTWYKKEYDQFHRENPEYIERIPINEKELMDKSLSEGLLFLYSKNDEKIGLIAGEKDTFLGKNAIYLNEILIANNFRGKGHASDLLASFINILNADYFICDIDSDNIPSSNTALKSGQKVFSQEVFVEV